MVLLSYRYVLLKTADTKGSTGYDIFSHQLLNSTITSIPEGMLLYCLVNFRLLVPIDINKVRTVNISNSATYI